MASEFPPAPASPAAAVPPVPASALVGHPLTIRKGIVSFLRIANGRGTLVSGREGDTQVENLLAHLDAAPEVYRVVRETPRRGDAMAVRIVDAINPDTGRWAREEMIEDAATALQRLLAARFPGSQGEESEQNIVVCVDGWELIGPECEVLVERTEPLSRLVEELVAG